MTKEITIAFYRRRLVRQDPILVVDESAKEAFFADLEKEFAPFGITVRSLEEADLTMDVKGYGDLLNSIRLRSLQDGIGNLCLGHVIGVSSNRHLFEDIRRAINRVAFAPETIEPEGSDKVVCHNCGCGC